MDIDKKVKKYISEEQKLLKSLKLEKNLTIRFNGVKVPFLSKIAVKIIRSQGGFLDIQFKNIKQNG